MAITNNSARAERASALRKAENNDARGKIEGAQMTIFTEPHTGRRGAGPPDEDNRI